MNKTWDSDKGGRDNWIAWMSGIAGECLRVLKPGGHALVWAIPRTSHWTATAWENAGFEIRDIIAHVFGSGFPKSLNIGKKIDEMQGNEREVVEEEHWGRLNRSYQTGVGINFNKDRLDTRTVSKGSSQWEGWGTALKPAREDWILMRKPITEKNIALNVLKWGTGGINIDECRIEHDEDEPNIRKNPVNHTQISNIFPIKNNNHHGVKQSTGRFPSNFIHDGSEEVMAGFPEDASPGNGVRIITRQHDYQGFARGLAFCQKAGKQTIDHGDSGSAARFFYCAKASPSERNEGLEGFEPNPNVVKYGIERFNTANKQKNQHPTVKPVTLMEYLIKLVTPADGIVLDPFMGSGSTGVAAMNLKRKFIGIEMNDEYFAIAKARIEKALCPGEIFKALPN